MNLLDQWENYSKPIASDDNMFTGVRNDHKKIIALIDLVRKKDEALRFYADEKTWSPDHFLCLSEMGRQDLSETKYRRFTPGKTAREAISLTEQLK